jgi:hypothetical protein
VTLHAKFSVVEHLAKGHFMRARGNRMKLLILGDRSVGLILSKKEGQKLYPRIT